MIEIICNGEEQSKDKNDTSTKNASIRQPKNIKQIGDISSDRKIYIEDYVFTYIHSLADKEKDEEQAGVLLGECQKAGKERYFFIKGVIKAKCIEEEKQGIYFNDKIWDGIYSDIEKFFPNLEVVGWFAALPYVTEERKHYIERLHLDNFAGSMKTLYLINKNEKDENFYLYEDGKLKKQNGYVCYYERNYEMQEYMLQKKGNIPMEAPGQDKVMKSIRSIINEKEEKRIQKRNAVYVYGAGAFVAIVVLVVGINLLNSYEKMKNIDKSINNMAVQMSGFSENETLNDNLEDVVSVNKLNGDVYPSQSENNSEVDKNQQNQQSANNQSVAGNQQNQQLANNQSGVGNQQNQQPANNQSGVGNQQNQQSINNQSVAGNQQNQQPVNNQEAAGIQENISSTQPSENYSEYIVQSGDTIMKICKNYYGDVSKYKDVMKYNNLDENDYLYAGQVVKLP